MSKIILGMLIGFFLSSAIYHPERTKTLFAQMVDAIHQKSEQADLKQLQSFGAMATHYAPRQQYEFTEESVLSGAY